MTDERERDLQKLQDVRADLVAVHGLEWKEIAFQSGVPLQRLQEFIYGGLKTLSADDYAKLRSFADKWLRTGWLHT